MAAPKIMLFVDMHDPVFKACEITYTPIFLGGLFKLCGTVAPLTVKNKDRWIDRERTRWATAFSIPMKAEMPSEFPPMTLDAMRVLSVIAGEPGAAGATIQQEQLTVALDSLYAAFWVEHSPVHRLDRLEEVLADTLGHEAASDAIMRSKHEGKDLLKRNTNWAFDLGAFGLPWMCCTNAHGKTEGFWGVDHLGQVVQFMGLQKPSQRGWRALL